MRIPARIIALASLLLLVACGGGSDEEMVLEARAYMAVGEIDAATIELKNALQEDGENAEARYLLGKIYYDQSDLASAEKELQRARRLGYSEELVFPPLAEALLALGQDEELAGLAVTSLSPQAQATVQAAQGLSELAKSKLDTAEELIDEALAKAPESSYAGVAAARLLAVQGNMSESRAALEEILLRDPGYVAGWSLLGDVEAQEQNLLAADKAYTQAIELGSDQLDDRLKRALLRIQQQDYEGAREDVDILAARSPQHPGVGYALGLLHFYRQELQEAIAAFAIAERDRERYPLSLLYAGTAHYTLGNSDQAAGYANLFHNTLPANVAGRKLLATIKLGERDYARVEELVAPVLEFSPDDIGALNLMANALLGLERTDEGIDMLQRVAHLQPDSSVAQVRLGVGLLLGGEQRGGVEKLETALELDPNFQQAEILLALNYLQQGEFEQAVAAAKGYRLRNLASVTPHNLLGRIYLSAGDREQAVDAFNAALRLEPGDPTANHNLAELALSEGDRSGARKYYDAVLADNEDFLPTLLKLAELNAEDGDVAAMQATLRRAIDAHPEAVEPRIILARYYLTQGKPEQVSLLLGELDGEARNIPAVLVEIAQAQLAQGEFVQAEFTLNQNLALRPADTQSLFLLGMALDAQGKRAAAIEQLDKLISLDDKHVNGRLVRARIRFADQGPEAVQADLEKLVGLAPEHPGVLKLQASVAARDGRQEDALAFLEQAMEVEPSTQNMLLLASLTEQMGDESAALAMRKDWVQDNPEDMAARMALALVYSVAGREQDAMKQYREVLERDPDNFLALNNMAWYLGETDLELALEYAERAVSVNPESAEALDTLAVLQLRIGDTARAERSIDRALEKMPGHPSLTFHRAQIAIAGNEVEKARSTLESLLARQDDFPERDEAEQLLKSL